MKQRPSSSPAKAAAAAGKDSKDKDAASKVVSSLGSLETGLSADQEWYLCFYSLVALNLCTRFYKIAEPAWVCWDETHFGKMGSW